MKNKLTGNAEISLCGFLFENTSQGFCVIERIPGYDGKPVDFRYLLVNTAFEHHTGLSGITGKTIREILPDVDDYIMSVYDSVATTGVSGHFEFYIAELGIWFSAEVFPADVPGQIAVLFNNITEKRSAEQVLRDNNAHRELLLRLSDTLRQLHQPEKMEDFAAKLLREHFDAGWCYFIEWDDAKSGGEVHNDARREGLNSLAGTHDMCDGCEFIKLIHLKAVSIPEIDSYPIFPKNLLQKYQSVGVRSFLAIPLVESNQISAILVIADNKHRIWSEAAIALSTDVALRTWSAVEKLHSEKELQELNLHLEQQIRERTAELEKSKDFLRATIDSSPDMIQVFKAVRDQSGKIVDFKWILNNATSEILYGDVGDRTLLENNPAVVETGIFDAFVRVTETGIPEQYEKHYKHEQFDGWFYQSVVKLEDGVATSTADITARKTAELKAISLNNELLKKNRELQALHSELRTFNQIAANDYRHTLQKLYTGFEHIIKEDAPRLSDSSKANIRRTQSNVQKLKLLTDDIISYSGLSQRAKKLLM